MHDACSSSGLDTTASASFGWWKPVWSPTSLHVPRTRVYPRDFLKCRTKSRCRELQAEVEQTSCFSLSLAQQTCSARSVPPRSRWAVCCGASRAVTWCTTEQESADPARAGSRPSASRRHARPTSVNASRGSTTLSPLSLRRVCRPRALSGRCLCPRLPRCLRRVSGVAEVEGKGREAGANVCRQVHHVRPQGQGLA